MIIHEMKQYSPEWWAIRKGIPTASRARDLITAKTGALSTSSAPYINELIADRLGLGEPPIEPTEWMIRGSELEPEARRFFTFATELQVREVGFITNDEGSAGCSPDSLIPAYGETLFDEITADQWQVPPNVFHAGLEIKCPMTKTHIGYLLNGGLADYYKQQVHFSLALTGLDVWYWMSYHPELEPLIVPVKRDEYTAMVEKAIAVFIVEQKKAMTKLGIS